MLTHAQLYPFHAISCIILRFVTWKSFDRATFRFPGKLSHAERFFGGGGETINRRSHRTYRWATSIGDENKLLAATHSHASHNHFRIAYVMINCNSSFNHQASAYGSRIHHSPGLCSHYKLNLSKNNSSSNTISSCENMSATKKSRPKHAHTHTHNM